MSSQGTKVQSSESTDPGLVANFRNLAAIDLCELAMLQDRELTSEMLQGLDEVDFPNNLGICLESTQAIEVCKMIREAVQELAEPDTETLDDLAADYASIFLNYAYQASPCESPWLDEDGLSYQEPMFQIREIYGHYGLQAEDWRLRSEDHIVMQMLFVAHLLQLDSDASLRDAANFLDEHTLRWVDRFAQRAVGRCLTRFYAGIVLLSSLYLSQLRDHLADILGEPRPTPAEIAERMAARYPQPDESDSSPCGSLCTPREEPKPGRRRYP